ncbi:fungal-specific transcription factor domain-containing protein [Aspergillus avenaceus]|uniref:Fungal-specific transcription factor domain-containing protein n=1 Tax=Aspergillus avenaceus TaxID=36643 RepID=A0A5N6U6A3_ASPAV|nr:fungal-specific transcription factor domain-containing protein [Aspergillus avenaceus]
MDPLHRESRVKKRSSNACQRCRRQKIKCSGSQPCDTCSRRKLACVFDERDQKILVTRGYIEDLHKRIALLEQGEGDVFSPQSVEPNLVGSTEAVGDDTVALGEPEWGHDLDDATHLTNPLSTGPSTFMTAASGRTFYLGTSSNWAFARKVLSITHEYIYQSPLPTESLYYDDLAYDLGWDGARKTVERDIPAVPTLDFSLYLINAVKFHAGQLFHLFDERSFMSSLYAFYENPEHHNVSSGLWYIQFLLILAFGKAFVVQRSQGSRPSGCEFFVKALQLLPDVTQLCKESILATEIMCCMALYFQSLDYRIPAYNFIGQAIRIALAQGMHTDMPSEHLGDEVVQRCRRIWWTIYILDRQMTSLMGLPQSIRDDQIHHQPPCFPEAPQKATAMDLQIKMCQIMEEITSTVYGPDGRLNRRFLLKTKNALARTAELASELEKSYPLRLDESSISGVSRLSAHLHLLYHQCIILATRPVLFCFLKLRFQLPDGAFRSLNSSSNVRKLLQVCVDSARHMLSILSVLQGQTLLDCFLPFDLESAYISAVVLVTVAAVDSSLLSDWIHWLGKSYTILDELMARGNRLAAFRKSELDQLAGMLGQISSDRPLTAAESARKRISAEEASRLPSPLTPDHNSSSGYGVPEMVNFTHGLTTAEIMAVAESIDTGDVDWIAHAVTQNRIW